MSINKNVFLIYSSPTVTTAVVAQSVNRVATGSHDNLFNLDLKILTESLCFIEHHIKMLQPVE